MNSQPITPSENGPDVKDPAGSMLDGDTRASDNPVGLQADVRLALRSHRHDLAGRVQAVMGSAELLDGPDQTLPAEIVEAVGMLNDIVSAWRTELAGLDALLSGEVSTGTTSSAELQKILSTGAQLPDSTWACDSEMLAAALRHAYKAVGRTGFHHLRMTVQTAENLIVDVVSGDDPCMFDAPPRRVTDVFAGDLEGALTEASAHAAGVSVGADRTEQAAGIRFTIYRV